MSEELEKLYQIFKWVEDLDTPEGTKRLEKSVEKMHKILEHSSLQALLEEKDKITLIDVCSGKGIGFIALAKAILEKHDVKLDIIAVDLRRSALEKAMVYAEKILGLKIKAYVHDVTRIWELGVKADIGLLYGFSTPHFNPYDMVRLSAGMASVLDTKGVFLVEESDRIRNIYQVLGYKHVLPEHIDLDSIVLSIDGGRDPLKGVNRKLTIELISGKRILNEVRLWDIAGTASIIWSFFKHVDFIQYRSAYSGMIVAWEPRGIDPKQYSDYPEIISKEK
ncbi:MAG: hypothetical protein GXO43_08095 [Crenarchaeota archaeon]|nr:hypothetical protein [Thermoproteota archaeon]